MAHTSGMNENRRCWEELGYAVYTENQNGFALKGRAATLGGKPDVVARRGNRGFIIDVKTGRLSSSHVVQVIWNYMGLHQPQGIFCRLAHKPGVVPDCIPGRV